MPRHSTGKPRGRPVGTSKLGTIKRVTVHLPTDLYARLEAYAEGRSFARGGAPQLPTVIREAIATYLDSPQKRQTQPRVVTDTVTDTDTQQAPARRRKRVAASADEEG